MIKKIQVKQKFLFGNEQVHPVCEQAKLFAKLVNSKVLKPETLDVITQLGYRIQFIM